MHRLALAVAGLLLATAPPASAFAPKNDAGRALAIAQGLPLTPQMFGARGNAIEDDSDAVESWLRSGSPLFCSGTFKLTRGMIVQLKPGGGLFLQGAGRQSCKILLAAPTAGLRIVGGRPDLYRTPEIVIHDVGLAPAAIMTRPALDIAFTEGSGATDPTLDLRDIAVKPTALPFFAPTCIRLDNARNGSVQGVNCEGRRGRYAPDSTGVAITGDAQPVELTLRDVNTYYMDMGIALSGTWQGVSINEAVCVACRVGVKAEASNNNGAWLRVNDSHFNVTDYGVETINIVNVDVFGSYVLLNQVGDSRAPRHACFSITMQSQATMWAKVANNACDGIAMPASPKVGVYMTSVRKPSTFLMESRIDGNSFYMLDWGVYLDNAAAVAIGQNTFAEMHEGRIWNGSSGSGVFANTLAPPDWTLRSGAN